MSIPYCDASSTRWLTKTCRLLLDDDYPTDIALSFDGSEFADYCREDATSVFFQAIRKWGKATRLTLKNIALDPKSRFQLESALEANAALQQLALVNLTSDDHDVQFLSRSLFSGNKTISDLTLDNCQVRQKDAHLIQRLLGSGSLRSLTLHNMNLDDTLIRISSRLSLDSTLHHLDFSSCVLNTNALVSLCACLCNNVTLKSLALDHCGIGTSVKDDLDSLLFQNKVITSLSLCNNLIDKSMIEKWTEHGLKYNTTLQKLALSQNPVGDEGAEKLAQLLQSNPTIRSLSLINSDVWGIGCHALASGLASMRGLRELFVDGEMEDHASTVLQSLEWNMTLQHLWTERSAYLIREDHQWRLVEFYLRLNRGKRRILTEPSIPASIWPRILEGISGDPRLIFYMLRQKPELFANSSVDHDDLGRT